MFKPGDIVIGSTDPSKSVYSATGAKLVENSFSLYGTEDQLEQMEKELITSVTRNGGKKIGTLSSTEKKKTKKIKKPQAATNTSFIVYNEPEDISDFAQKDVSKEEVYTTVQFENDFGISSGGLRFFIHL